MKLSFFNIIYSILILFSSKSGNAAVKALYPASIAWLVNSSENIYHAKFIKSENSYFYFAVKDILSEKDFSDTIKIPDNSNEFDTIQNRYYSPRLRFINNKIIEVISDNKEKLITIQDADELVIFIFKDYNTPMYFINKQNQVYREGYNERVEKRNFYKIKDRTWKEQILIIQKVVKRINIINEIHRIKDDVKRNKELFKWINKNKSSFNHFCGFDEANDDCGWAYLDTYAFRWITEAGNREETWKAATMYREIMFAKREDYKILFDYGKNSFNSYTSIIFLLRIAVDTLKLKDERLQALEFLRSSCFDIIYDQDSSIFKFNQDQINILLNRLFPLLLEKDFNYTTFEIISNFNLIVNLKKNNKEYFNNLCNLYNDEKPSRYKDELVDFIYENSNEREWQDITGNPKKILIVFEHFEYSSVRNQLYINVKNNDNSEPINFSPILIMEKKDKNNVFIEKKRLKLKDFVMPFKNGQSRSIEISVDKFSQGIWKFYLTGHIEKKSKKWKSEYSILNL